MADHVVEGKLIGIRRDLADPSGVFPILQWEVAIRLLPPLPTKPMLSLGRKVKVVFEDEEPGPVPQTGERKDG